MLSLCPVPEDAGFAAQTNDLQCLSFSGETGIQTICFLERTDRGLPHITSKIDKYVSAKFAGGRGGWLRETSFPEVSLHMPSCSFGIFTAEF